MLNNLQKLRRWFELAEASSGFSNAYPRDVIRGSSPLPSVKRHKTPEPTAGVFHDIFNDPYAFLTHLSVEDRGQSSVLNWMIYVKRMEKDNALKRVDGGYTVTYADSREDVIR